jgi:hypothetical protein
LASAAALIGLTTACASTMTRGSETETAICEAWGDALPTRSRNDTQTTINEITLLYARFAAACPQFEGMIP